MSGVLNNWRHRESEGKDGVSKRQGGERVRQPQDSVTVRKLCLREVE